MPKNKVLAAAYVFGENLFESSDRDLDPVNDISFIRMRSMKNEILLAPGKVQSLHCSTKVPFYS